MVAHTSPSERLRFRAAGLPVSLPPLHACTSTASGCSARQHTNGTGHDETRACLCQPAAAAVVLFLIRCCWLASHPAAVASPSPCLLFCISPHFCTPQVSRLHRGIRHGSLLQRMSFPGTSLTQHLCTSCIKGRTLSWDCCNATGFPARVDSPANQDGRRAPMVVNVIVCLAGPIKMVSKAASATRVFSIPILMRASKGVGGMTDQDAPSGPFLPSNFPIFRDFDLAVACGVSYICTEYCMDAPPPAI